MAQAPKKCKSLSGKTYSHFQYTTRKEKDKAAMDKAFNVMTYEMAQGVLDCGEFDYRIVCNGRDDNGHSSSTKITGHGTHAGMLRAAFSLAESLTSIMEGTSFSDVLKVMECAHTMANPEIRGYMTKIGERNETEA